MSTTMPPEPEPASGSESLSPEPVVSRFTSAPSPEAPSPGRRESAPLRVRIRLSDLGAYAALGLFLIAFLGALYAAQGFLVPVTVALLLAFFLRPLVLALGRIGFPEMMGAAVVLLLTLGSIGYGSYRLSGPAAEWLQSAPEKLGRFEQRIRGFKEPVAKMSEATKEVEKITDLDGDSGPPPVSLKRNRLSDSLFSGTRKLAAKGLVTAILLFFLLAYGDHFLRKLVHVLPRLRDKKRAVEVARDIRRRISSYLFTFSLINLGLALAVGGAMALLGLPNPFLWGALAGVLNFVPYLGPLVTVSVISVVSVLTFDSIGRALPAPLVYLALNTVESTLVTPFLVGRMLTLNPLAIFLSLTFWGWLWGIPGALLAVPLLVVFKILCEQIEPLQPLGEFLGR